MKFLLLLLVLLSSCAFEVDGVSSKCTNRVDIETQTKYRTLFVGPCNFSVSAEVFIDEKYKHYEESIHYLYGKYGIKGKELERGKYGFWNDLVVNLPCSACLTPIVGGINVLDQKMNHIPWGCGMERPPLNITNIRATHIKKPENEEWRDTAPQTFTYNYYPEFVSDEKICDGDPVLLDLTQSCEVLVNAGLLEYK